MSDPETPRRELRRALKESTDQLYDTAQHIASLHSRLHDDPASTDSSFAMDDIEESLNHTISTLSEAIAPAAPAPSTSTAKQSYEEAAQISAGKLESFIAIYNSNKSLSGEYILAEVVTPVKSQMGATRLRALKHATSGLESLTCQDWKNLLSPYIGAVHDDKTILAFLTVENTSNDTQDALLASTHRMLVDLPEASGVYDWIVGVLVKLLGARFARRWYAQSTHDHQFPARMFRAIWATSAEGKAMLSGQDIEDVDVQVAFSKELGRSKKKEGREVVARNRILQMYARFGAIVFLDPNWELRTFRNQLFGPAAQAEAINYFATLATNETVDNPTSDHPLKKHQAASEWAVVNAVTLLCGEDMGSLVHCYLWELRRCSLL